jgi:L-iditol 2-dehydrogenase
MKAAILYGIKDIRVVNVPMPKIKKPDEVLLRVKSVGICGSDVHYYKEGKIGHLVVKDPQRMGHELSAVVVKTGKNVERFKKGDRVVLEPGISCGKCEMCSIGRPNCCLNVKFLGAPPIDGAYCEYIVFPEECLFHLPANISFEEGAALEPMTIGMYAIDYSNLKIGENIAILGFGPIGMVVLKAAILAGAGKIFVTDLLDERLKLAKKHKGDITVINAANEDPVELIMKATNKRGVDIVYEAAGSLDTISQSVEIVKIGGTIMWIGIPSEDSITIEPHIARHKEVVIKTVRRSNHCNQKSIDAAGSGKITLKDMITHRFKLKDIGKAFKVIENYEDGVMKAVVNP